jgi:hypothetical protein
MATEVVTLTKARPSTVRKLFPYTYTNQGKNMFSEAFCAGPSGAQSQAWVFHESAPAGC